MDLLWKQIKEDINWKAILIIILSIIILYHLIGLWIIPIYFFIALIKSVG